MIARALGQETAEDFALKVHNYGRMTGVSVALHAVPDAFLVLHTGVGCKYKGSNQLMLHDLARPALHREGYTEISDIVFVKGSASRIGPYLRSWYEKRRPAYMAVVASTFIEMAGEDIAAEVAKPLHRRSELVQSVRHSGFVVTECEFQIARMPGAVCVLPFEFRDHRLRAAAAP